MFSMKKWTESDCLEMDPAWLPSSRSPGSQAPRRVGHTLLPRPLGGGPREMWRKVAGPTRHRSHIFFWTCLIVFQGFTSSIRAALHLVYYCANDSKGLIRAQLGLLPMRGGGLAGRQGPVWCPPPPRQKQETQGCHAFGAYRNSSQHSFWGCVPPAMLILGFLGSSSLRPGTRGPVKHAALALVGTETNPAITPATMECPHEDTGLRDMPV